MNIDGNYCWSAISGERIGPGQPLVLFTDKKGRIMVRKPEEDPKEMFKEDSEVEKTQKPSVTSGQFLGEDVLPEEPEEEVEEEIEEEKEEKESKDHSTKRGGRK